MSYGIRSGYPSKDRTKTKRFNLRLPESQLERVEKLKEQLGLTNTSSLMRLIIDAGLDEVEKRESIIDALKAISNK
jgi:predicted DNA-binding protein